jgi:Tol biopolymer transport system component
MRPQIWRWQPGSGIRRLREGLWSPDGSAVAFDRTARNAGSATAVWITRNGRTVRITPIQPDFRWFPAAWSPDSSRLVLARFAVPPGTKPAYAVPSGPASLWLASGALGVSNLKRLPLPPAFGGQPGWPDVVFWSPDGRFVTVGVGPNQACNSCRADGRQYYAISAADGTFVALGTALSPDEAISWSPDGSYAVLSSGRLSRETYADKHLVQMSPITGTRHALTHGKRWADVEPAVVPDGKHIAFARGLAATPSTRLTNVQLIASRRLFLMDANGAQLHRLTSAPGWTDEAPVWSPDGHLLIFVRWRRHLGSQAAAAALWTVRADGTGAQRLAGLDLPSGFLNGFGYYGSFGWHDLFAVAP